MKQSKAELLQQAKAKEEEYKWERHIKLLKAKSEFNPFKRFCKVCWHYTSFPFIWLWQNLRDWRTIIIFVIVFAIMSCEIWIPYLIAFIVGVDTPLGITLLSVASTCWLFWLGPFTPFLPLCIVITIGVKALFNKVRFRGIKK